MIKIVRTFESNKAIWHLEGFFQSKSLSKIGQYVALLSINYIVPGTRGSRVGF